MLLSPIETGIPIPEKRNRGHGIYPWHLLQPGQSFLVPDFNREGSIRSCASTHSKRSGIKFVVRRMDDGIRVWRVL